MMVMVVVRSADLHADVCMCSSLWTVTATLGDVPLLPVAHAYAAVPTADESEGAQESCRGTTSGDSGKLRRQSKAHLRSQRLQTAGFAQAS